MPFFADEFRFIRFAHIHRPARLIPRYRQAELVDNIKFLFILSLRRQF